MNLESKKVTQLKQSLREALRLHLKPEVNLPNQEWDMASQPVNDIDIYITYGWLFIFYSQYGTIFIDLIVPETEFTEFEPRLKFKPRLKYGWFHLKLYSIFQD